MSRPLKLKVCGLRDPANIRAVAALRPDYLGMVFHRPSPRYAGDDFRVPDEVRAIPAIGVFVNEGREAILRRVEQAGLSGVQLHGSESPDLAAELRAEGLLVFKAISVGVEFDVRSVHPYQGSVDHFLFDTKSPAFGGSGQRFDWSALEGLPGGTPFLLSGGIGPDDAQELATLEMGDLCGVDVNSRFETAPGMKDIAMLEAFISALAASGARPR